MTYAVPQGMHVLTVRDQTEVLVLPGCPPSCNGEQTRRGYYGVDMLALDVLGHRLLNICKALIGIGEDLHVSHARV